MQFSSVLLQKIQKTFAEKCGISPGIRIRKQRLENVFHYLSTQFYQDNMKPPKQILP
jgi:hypothetical protein